LGASSNMYALLIPLFSWHSLLLLANKLLLLKTHTNASTSSLITWPLIAKIWYRASDIVLNVHPNASYLSAPKACSQASGYFFLGSTPHDKLPVQINGTIHITCTILKLVAASADE
jgi:hypothetical protein